MGNIIEAVFYQDGECYYNYNWDSVDCIDLKDLKQKLKERFNYDFVKSKLSYTTGTLWKKYYKITL